MSDAFHKYYQLCKYSITTLLMMGVLCAASFPERKTQRKARKKTKITVRGTSINIHQAEMMVRYYVQYWELEDLHILVQFTASLPKQYQGYTQYLEHKNLQIRQVTIRISNKISEKQQWLTLAHEMIHVKQFRRGELVYHGRSAYTWKDQYCADVRKIAYKQRGWEKEAYALEGKMLERYQEAQRLVAKR
ncbi:hypothetical protein BKI52_13420 [marine bacterium AO1-C]|nr:hypothetical protein BKI52_13420 [marine bacterium AO1-C]